MEVLWEWNETDLTQFDEVGDSGFTVSTTTWTTRFGSIVDEVPAIQFDSPATSHEYRALLIKTSEFDLSQLNDMRFMIEARLCNRTAANTQDPIFLAYYEDSTHFLGIRHSSGGSSGERFIYRDGSTTANLPTDDINPVTRTDGGEVSCCGLEIHFASASTLPYMRTARSFVTNSFPRPFQNQTQAGHAASWNSLGSYQPRIGFGVYTFGVAAASGNLFSDLRILADTGIPTPKYQRVWDTTALQWCYYTKVVDSTPDMTETSPNHTGSITNHQVLG